jgi:hypothetical protein
MPVEIMLIAAAIATGTYFIGVPIWKLVKKLSPQKLDPISDAKERLELAKAELEAARLNKEAEKLYGKMYEEALQDDDSSVDEKTHNRSKL